MPLRPRAKNEKKHSHGGLIALICVLIMIFAGIAYLSQPAPTRNQCDIATSLTYSTADVSVYGDHMILTPYSVGNFGKTSGQPHISPGAPVVDYVSTVGKLQSTYKYDSGLFNTTTIYRGQIIFAGGSNLQDGLFYIERFNLVYTNCVVPVDSAASFVVNMVMCAEGRRLLG